MTTQQTEEGATRYYHGGAPDLTVILPPRDTKARSLAEFGAEGVCRRDKVYITTNYDAALMFASLHPSGRGMVYEVVPMGPVEDDPDFNRTEARFLSLQCDWARIKRRYRVPERDAAAVRVALFRGGFGMKGGQA